MDNLTNFTFNCLARDNLSSDSITDPEHWSVRPELEVAAGALAALYAILFLIAFSWNLFIVVTFLVKYKLLKEPGNILLFNYALIDLFIAVTQMMFSCVAQAAKEFVFGYTDTVRCGVCGFAGFSSIFFVFLSFHLLAALSIDRFILLSNPLRYKHLMTPWRALVIVVIMWIVCFVVAILPFIGFGQDEFNRRVGGCIPRIGGINIISGVNNFFYALLCVLEALIPILIIAVTNVCTFRLVRKFLRANLKRTKSFRNEEETTANKEKDKKYKQQQIQLVKVFGALFITNLIAWTPMIATVLILALGITDINDVTNGLLVFAWICCLTNPALHPIIESFFVKELRDEIERAQRVISWGCRAIWRAVRRDTRATENDTELHFGKKRKEEIDSTMYTEEVVMDEMFSETGDSSYVVATSPSSDLMY